MNPNVDWFFARDTPWQQEYKELRAIIISCGLSEELKWGCPCYTYNGSNVVLIQGFKAYCALLFPKGVLLPDSAKLLRQQTKNVQSARQIRFSSMNNINELAPTIRTYLHEAVEVEKAGLNPELKSTHAYPVPAELQRVFRTDSGLKTAFESLTPGRQRGYLLHFSQPKQAKTRQSRIEKCIPKILRGEGLNDHYEEK